MNGHSLTQRPKQWHALALSLATCHLLLFLSSCGFHLRGQDSTALPNDLSALRVRVVSSRVPGGSLQLELEQALVVQAGVTLVTSDNDSAPTLYIYSEQSDGRAISVDRDVKVSEFLLRYQVVFGVTDTTGEELVKRQTITFQRGFIFDKLQVLAKDREAQEVREQMRADAVQAIIRKLAARAR